MKFVLFRPEGRPWDIRQCFVLYRETGKVPHVVIPAPGNKRGTVEPEPLDQHFQAAQRYTGLMQEPGSQAGISFGQLFFYFFGNVTVEFVFQVKLGIPGDLKTINSADRYAGKDKGYILPN